VLDLQTFNASETIASVSGAGAVDLGPNSIFTINNATGGSVFAGSINGGGSLVKGGGSSLELSGSSDIAGGTTVAGGTLVVSGTLGGALTVNAGAILGGSGTLNGPLSVQGTLAPGTSPGDLTVNNIATFGTTSTLALELNGTAPGSSYDQLTIGSSGGVSILGGNISLSLGFAPIGNEQFRVIDNLSSSAISGTFTNLANGGVISAVFNGTQYDFVANYSGGTGNDLVLTVPEPTSATVLLAGLTLTAGLRRLRRKS
jgi:fibronectin-binding autotransporter adhesin